MSEWPECFTLLIASYKTDSGTLPSPYRPAIPGWGVPEEYVIDVRVDGSEEERTIPFMKGYSVFNVEQIEGLPEHFYTKPDPVIDPALRIDHAEAFFAASGADIRHGGNRAFYAGGRRALFRT